MQDGCSSNAEYAKKAGTTKKATQAIILKLKDRGYLTGGKLTNDHRREPLMLTNEGMNQIHGFAQLPTKSGPAQDNIEGKVKTVLRSGNRVKILDLCDQLDAGPNKIKSAIDQLIKDGYNIDTDGETAMFTNIIPKKEPTKLSVSKLSTGFYRFGVTGDNHLCSKYERMDVLNALYDYFQEQGITTVYNTGNWIDGEARFNKHDIHTHGLGNQVRYFVDNFPKREGITTYYISGDDHEGWYTQREGIDVGRFAEMQAQAAGRSDLVYIGHMEADVHIPAENGETIIRVQHPGGGSAYAISYTSQKIVESLTGNEKPHILLVGHYHKAEYLYTRGVHTIQTGCTQGQTPFMRKKRLSAHLGGWVVEFATDTNGAITKIKTEFIPFYDTDYYKQWKYEW